MPDDAAWEDLIERASSGDQQAAADLIEEFEPELRRFVRYRLTDPQLRAFIDTVDVTQSVFANFFVHLAQGRLDICNPRQLFGLLNAMARNKLQDHLRRARADKRDHRREPVSDNWQPLDGVAGSDLTASRYLSAREMVDLFRRELSADELELLDLRMEGNGWNEMAKERGEAPDTLRKRLSRAVDRAAAKLGFGDET